MSAELRPKILIMAGGTGGHVFPALTIARELLARGASVEWLGTRAGIEARVVPANGIPLHFITIGGLRGKGLLKKLAAPLVILWATLQSLARIASLRPQCVLGMGGFVCGPGGLAARMLGRKLLIHEQNAVAGLTNQLLSSVATQVLEAFPGAFERKRALSGPVLRRWGSTAKPVLVGNPVRAELLELPPPGQRLGERSGSLRLLVLGGSLGAAALNRVMPGVLCTFLPGMRPLVRHQCGERNLVETRQWYREAGLLEDSNLQLCAFIEDMAEAYAWADLVLCRAGASTVAELSAVGLASILVPYPHAVDDHQYENARVLEAAGAAVLLRQEELSAARLAARVREFTDRSVLLRRSEAAHALGQRDAGSRVADLCLEASHG